MPKRRDESLPFDTLFVSRQTIKLASNETKLI
jgi:hypothetical protein